MEVMMRYGYGDAADVAWKVGRIMLKYRPIAPKPVAGGAVAAPLDGRPSSSGRGKRKGASKEGRRGRKSLKRIGGGVVQKPGVFSKENNNNNSNNDSRPPEVVTLLLMPMTPERRDRESARSSTPSPTASDECAALNCFGRATWQQQQQQAGPTSLLAPRPVRPVGSWVTVECLTDTWQDASDATPTDLNRDTCPVFVSESGSDRVAWVNEAYRRMVVGPRGEREGEEEEEIRVALMTRGMVPEGVTCFTCRVRVRHACRMRGKVTMTVPCDARRMSDGRIAWRLDVKAALSLSCCLGC